MNTQHRRPELHLPLVLLAIATIMALVTTVEGAAFRWQRGDALDLQFLLTGRLLDWYTCALMVPPLYWVTAASPIESGRWRRALPIHLVATSIAAASKLALYTSIRSAIDPGHHRGLADAITSDFLGKLMFFWAVTAVLHALHFHRGARPLVQQPPDPSPPARADGCEWIAVPAGRSGSFIRSEEIDWIEAQGNYALIHAGGEQHIVRETMQRLADRLDSMQFVRVHRSAIVNLASVRSVEPGRSGRYRLTLRSGAIVSSGRSYAQRLRSLLP
jgi:hypothetical protein